MRYFISLSYDGAPFCGWQTQNAAPTVQACLEKALSTLLGADVALVGAGRTDTAVNAICYAAHFESGEAIEADTIRYKLNAILPEEIVVHELREVPDGMHARFSAQRREYTYFINTKKDPFVRKYSFLCTYPLDFDKMAEAAALLVGTHDFSCFQKTGSDVKTSICTVVEAGWHSYSPSHVSLMHYPGDGEYFYFRIAADRFLRNMVRAIVGTLIEVGRGKRSVSDFASLIRDPADSGIPGSTGVLPARSRAGESVPGHALFLSGIKYAGD